MVRVGGIDYTCDPDATMGSRISDLRLASGQQLDASKSYKVAGWATVGTQSPGAPVWDVVAEYLKSKQTIKVEKLNTPTLRNVADNPGIGDYSGIVES